MGDKGESAQSNPLNPNHLGNSVGGGGGSLGSTFQHLEERVAEEGSLRWKGPGNGVHAFCTTDACALHVVNISVRAVL